MTGCAKEAVLTACVSGGDGNVGACKENVFYILRIWGDKGAVMGYLVCFCEKEDGPYDEEGQGEEKEERGEGDGERGEELPYQGGWHCWYRLRSLCHAYQMMLIRA